MKSLRELINIINEYDITSPEITKSSRKNEFDPQRLQTKQDEIEDSPKLKSGSFLFGKQSPSKPHEFNKASFFPTHDENDPQYIFYTECLKINGQNRFLPVFYQIKKIEHKPKKSIKQYKTETLHDVSKLPIHSAIASIKRSLEDDLGYDINNNLPNLDHQDTEDALYSLKSFYSSVIREYLQHDRIPPDKEMAQALSIIRKVRNQSNDYFYDIHWGNIMFRYSGGLYTPVFNDPLAA